MNSGVCKHKFCELTQGHPHPPAMWLYILPVLLSSCIRCCSACSLCYHQQNILCMHKCCRCHWITLGRAHCSEVYTTMQERERDREREREGAREGTTLAGRWRGLAWTPVWLLTLFHCLSCTWWSAAREALPYFTVFSLATLAQPLPPPPQLPCFISNPISCLFHSDSFNPVGLH